MQEAPGRWKPEAVLPPSEQRRRPPEAPQLRPGAGADSAVGTDSDRSGRIRSPSMPSPSRLVTSNLTAALPETILSATRQTSSSRCSQLSRISRSRRAPACSQIESSKGFPAASRMPSEVATASATRLPSWSGARSTNHAPSGNKGSMCSASFSASRVLPQPPIPVRVSTRVSPSRRAHSASSRSRPMKCVRCLGRLLAGSASAAGGGVRVESPAADAVSASANLTAEP